MGVAQYMLHTHYTCTLTISLLLLSKAETFPKVPSSNTRSRPSRLVQQRDSSLVNAPTPPLLQNSWASEQWRNLCTFNMYTQSLSSLVSISPLLVSVSVTSLLVSSPTLLEVFFCKDDIAKNVWAPLPASVVNWGNFLVITCEAAVVWFWVPCSKKAHLSASRV